MSSNGMLINGAIDGLKNGLPFFLFAVVSSIAISVFFNRLKKLKKKNNRRNKN